MSKKIKKQSIDLEKTIMAKVKSNEISMKPKWYFYVGSFLSFAGLVGCSIGAIFLTNITFFLLKKHGPMGQWRLQQFIASFPVWIPILAIVSIVLGIGMLRKYDFSYKKNFSLIIIGFILSIIIASFAIDRLGLNTLWFRQGPMRRLYEQLEQSNPTLQKRPGHGRGQRQRILPKKQVVHDIL